MLLHHVVKINYILNMDNNNVGDKPLATIVRG